MLGVSDDPLHGLQRAGGNCAFPSEDLTRAGAGVSGVFVATSFKAAVLAARLRRCEPPPSQMFFRGRMCFRTACPTVLSACPAVPADPKSATSMRSFGRTRGPRPELGAAHPVPPRSARAGPAAVRTALPCPVASSCAPTTVTQRRLRPQYAAADPPGPGLDARPSSRWCHRAHPAVPSGRSFLDAVRTNAEGALIPRPDLGAARLHPVVRSPTVSGVQAYLSPGADARCLYDTTHLSTKGVPS